MSIASVPFGRTGESVAGICLGTMMFGDKTGTEESIAILHAALDAGLTFWDTAPMYGEGRTEAILGKALAGRRDRVFLASKVNDVRRQAILEGCDASLTRLGTDRLDLFQIHWPRNGIDLDEMTRALDDLVRAGKVRHLGCCNFPAWLLARARGRCEQAGRAALVSLQPPYNLIERGIEVEVLPMCRNEGIAVIPYRPLVMGLLTGKYQPGAGNPADSRGSEDERIGRTLGKYESGVRRLTAFAQARGVTPAAVAIAWVRAQAGVTAPIVGLSRRSQLDDLVKAAALKLSDTEAEEVAGFFNAGVKEEALGNYGKWRRDPQVLAATPAS